MRGLRPVGILFSLFATIAWVMVAVSIVRNAPLPDRPIASQRGG